MQSPKFDIIVKQADSLLYSATEELKNSENELVTYQACNNSRESIRKYLTSFLLKNKIEPIEPVTLASLLDQCKTIDKRFALIDLTDVLCRHDATYDDYCLDAQKVNQCLNVAKQTRKIVLG